MAMDVLDDGKRLFHLGEQLAIDVFVKISVLEVMTVKGGNHVEIVHIHRQITVAVDAAEAREIVIEHHRHLEAALLVVLGEFFLVGLVVKVGRHDVVLEVPVTPIKLLIGIDIFSHRVDCLIGHQVTHFHVVGIEFHASPCQSHTETACQAMLLGGA